MARKDIEVETDAALNADVVRTYEEPKLAGPMRQGENIVRDGLSFTRGDAGKVTVRFRDRSFELSGNEWAAIVAHVGARGTSEESRAEALRYHTGAA